jgi:hypothetical protein
MRKLLGWFSVFAWAALSLTVAAQDQKKTAPAPKKTTSAKTAKKSPAGKAAAKSKTGSKSAPKKAAAKSPGKSAPSKSAARKSSKSAKKAPPRTTWRNRQTTPTPERYKQIQNALVAKGFLSPEDASGQWGQDSTDALKKFQAAQNIQSTGKIDSLSLIALGLGPRHDDATPPKPPETPPQAP